MMSEKKALKAIPQRILATVLTLALLILTFPTALMASAEESPQGYIVLSVEKFTLGLGYIREPELVPFTRMKPPALFCPGAGHREF